MRRLMGPPDRSLLTVLRLRRPDVRKGFAFSAPSLLPNPSESIRGCLESTPPKPFPSVTVRQSLTAHQATKPRSKRQSGDWLSWRKLLTCATFCYTARHENHFACC